MTQTYPPNPFSDINGTLVTLAVGIKANADAITSLTTTVKGNTDAITALTGRVGTLEGKVTALQASGTGGTGTGGTGTGGTGTGGTGTNPGGTPPSAAMIANASAIQQYMYHLPTDLTQANSAAINSLLANRMPNPPSLYGLDPTQTYGVSSILSLTIAYIQQVNPLLGQANNLAINNLPAVTFPVALPDLSGDNTTTAGQKALLTAVFQVLSAIDAGLGQANNLAINNLAAGTYPRSFPALQAM